MSGQAAILTLNAGSSSLKFGLFDAGPANLRPLWRGELAALDGKPTLILANGRETIHEPVADLRDKNRAADFLLDWIGRNLSAGEIVAVGHRVVHGGETMDAPVIVDDAIIARLKRLIPLAPLHLPHNIEAIEAVRQRFPALPQVACFDTSFHRSMAWREKTYALPREWYEHGVQRYGFHGLSYEYIAARLGDIPELDDNSRVVVAHLGHGASLCAMRNGKSVATTMGFTPLDGLPMATRPGALDPGVVLWFIRQLGIPPGEVETLLNEKSGLLGLSGISGDMRVLLAADSDAARQAIDYFVHHTQRAIASMAAALGGIDALVFTGGIGENSPVIREAVCREAAWLGMEIDDDANAAGLPRISAEGSAVTVLCLPTDEERVIAGHVLELAVAKTAGALQT